MSRDNSARSFLADRKRVKLLKKRINMIMTHIEIIRRFAKFDILVYPVTLKSNEHAFRIVSGLGYSMNKTDKWLCERYGAAGKVVISNSQWTKNVSDVVQKSMGTPCFSSN